MSFWGQATKRPAIDEFWLTFTIKAGIEKKSSGLFLVGDECHSASSNAATNFNVALHWELVESITEELIY